MSVLPLTQSAVSEGTFECLKEDWIEQSVINLFEQAVARHGDKVAVDDGVTRLAYCELRRAVFHLAQRIAALVPVGHPVGILLPPGARFPIAALACLAVGRPYVPIDPTYPAELNEQLVREAGLAAVIVDGAQVSFPYLPASLTYLNIANSLEEPGDPKVSIASANGPAVILYTSGSSGRPKGICYDQRAILERVVHATTSKRLCSDDRVFLLSSPGTIGGLRVPFLALLNGATLYWADPRQIGVDGALRFLQYARPTVGFAVPALLRTLLGLPGAKQAFTHARVIRTGGDVILKTDPALWQAVLPGSCRIFVTLTSTEMPAVFQWYVPPEWKADGACLPVGYPRSGVSFMLVDANGAPVPVGEAGELVVKSPYLALGHWQDGRLQPGPFLKDPNDTAVRILHTGDLIRMREDGLAEMTGRKDRQLKIRGFRIEPGDVENVLRGCAGVADVAVIARRIREKIVSLVAFVVPRDPGDISFAEELKKEVALRLPLHMRPSHIRFIDVLPQLPGFKIDIPALEKLDEKQRAMIGVTTSVSASVTPRTSTEEALVGIWCEVLTLKQVGVHDNFFELGGDSLMVVHLAVETNRVLKASISALDVFQNPTVEQLARLIVEQGPIAKRVAKVIQLQKGKAGFPIYFINAGPDEFRMARLMGDDHPVFGIEVPWALEWHHAAAENRKSVLPNMEQRAAPYVAELNAHAGASRCVLAGHSMAGLIAFEAARQFQKHGGKVEMVMLFDSWLKWPSGFKAAWHRLRQIWRQEPNRLPAHEDLPSLGRRLKNSWQAFRWMLGRQAIWLWVRECIDRALMSKAGVLTSQFDEMGMPIEGGLYERLNRKAISSFGPRCLDSRGVLFRANDPYSQFFHAVDASNGWMDMFRGGLEIIPVNGDHLSMIRDEWYHPTLAKAIKQALMQLQGQPNKADIN